ncbi:MAG: hypothetical protein ABI402_13125 [Ferruginibacter sp.]
MRKINPVFRLLFTAGISTMLFSCGGEKKEAATDEAAKPADTTSSMQMAPTPPAPAAFTPFDVAEITHTVKDYATWRPGFNADSVNRRAAGLNDLVVGAGMDKPNNIFIALGISDMQKAKDFAASPKLKETMTKLGVISKPGIEYFHVIRFNTESHEKKWVIVTHKVKDFDAWQKVYDGEGTAKRLSEGMVDVMMARGIDDPNMVQVVFDITDMDKAKAAIASEEKKKLMMSAGVVGTPRIQFYNTVE